MVELNPSKEPKQITAGDRIQWRRCLSDFPASEWTLSYALVNAGGNIAIVSVADGDDHQITISSDTSKDFAAGHYRWQAYVTRLGDRRTVDQGEIEIKPDFASAGKYDGRSQVKRTLDAINRTIEGTASRDDEEYEIQGRSLKRRSVEELLLLKSQYERYYRQEQAGEGLNKGLGGRRPLKVRF